MNVIVENVMTSAFSACVRRLKTWPLTSLRCFEEGSALGSSAWGWVWKTMLTCPRMWKAHWRVLVLSSGQRRLGQCLRLYAPVCHATWRLWGFLGIKFIKNQRPHCVPCDLPLLTQVCSSADNGRHPLIVLKVAWDLGNSQVNLLYWKMDYFMGHRYKL